MIRQISRNFPRSRAFAHNNNTVGLKPLSVSTRGVGSLPVILLLSTLMVGCGGGGGDGGASPNNTSLILGGSSGQPADMLSDEQVKLAAAEGALNGLGLNLGGLQTLSDDANAVLEPGTPAGDLLEGQDTSAIASLDSGSESFINDTLGINDPMATTVRTGNQLTITPDPASVCADDGAPGIDDMTTGDSICEQLMTDVQVQIDAVAEDSGIITYLFAGSPVLLVGYSPDGGSYELRLDGLNTLLQRVATLEEDSESETLSLQGALRFAARVISDQPGAEAGEMSLTVTQPVTIGQIGEAFQLSLQNGTVFESSFDQATEVVTSSVDWGALSIIDSIESNGSSVLAQFGLAGLSSDLQLNNNELVMSNIGIGNVPLSVTINDVQSLRLGVNDFNVRVDGETGTVTFDSALAVELFIDNVMQLLQDQSPSFTALLQLGIPGGTELLPQDNGQTRVVAGGPVTVSGRAGDGSQNLEFDQSVNVGECLGEADDSLQISDDVGGADFTETDELLASACE